MNTANPPVLPKPRMPRASRDFPGDNVYMKPPANGPQAYVPYSPGDLKPYGRPRSSGVAKDTSMAPIAIIGMVLTVMFGLPVGIFTGPSALKRANKVEQFVKSGKRPSSDLTDVSTARVWAWIGIVLSVPLIILWTVLLFGMLILFAG